MRVTGGRYAGRRISCPAGVIRPAMDRMRESFFAILGHLADCSFLDLYCGSGIVGIEASSRGAEPVVLVERDRVKRSAILKNIELVESSIELFVLPVKHFLRLCHDVFDVIFVDPPFNMQHKIEVLGEIDKRNLLRSSGCLIMHTPKQDKTESTIGNLSLADRRTYGQSILLFYRYLK